MFKRFITWLCSPRSELENYILSKNPTNAAEVDYWVVQYSYRTDKGYW